MHDQQNTRQPATELTPEELFTVTVFGIHEPELDAAEAES